MTEVSWGGMTVQLLCGLGALQEIEEQLGSLQKLFDNLKKKQNLTETVGVLFRAMARCAYEARHQTPDEIMIEAMGGWLADESIAGDIVAFMGNRDAVFKALNSAFKVEYEGKGKKKDKYTKAVEERMAKKEGRKRSGKLSVRGFYSDALCAGLTYTEARYLTPGFVREMALRRVEFEMDINPLCHMGGSGQRKPTPKRRR